MADVQSNERKLKVNKNGKVVKKRSRNPEEWHKQKQKRLRIAGLEYINANGKIVPPKQPGPDCNCRRKCFQKVPEDVRLKTFQGFYSMKTHDEQNAYLFGLMRQVDVKRKRVKSSSRRTCTFEYFVRVKGRETQVCQTAFKNIHAITERKVRVLCKKMDDGIMFPSDNRGKNSHRRSGEVRLPSGVVDQIKNHIYSIVHTHRLKDFIRLDKIAGLEINISKMWKDYIKTYDPDNITATMPKSKRSSDMVQPQNEPPPPPAPMPVPQESFAPIAYPGSGHLMNIAENYFENQYQTALTTSSAATNFYPAQSGQHPQGMGILLQSVNRPAQPTTFILLSAKPEPSQDNKIALTTMPYNEQGQTLEVSFETSKSKKPKKERKKGPIVKQWRYSNIFHDEINGAALAAIKTRLGMYYAESDAARKKAKQVRAQETVQTQTEQAPIKTDQSVVRPPHQLRATHTLTIFT
ncbi:uncharacterized protein LOC123691982 [Colias croceus]|uniref:uncharacterized protein LOC123691982 n=1 Tax=Colias crocea TaxID=72248 RepID=UPI001E27B9D2|nr:uncharacterized protein LOC123691982 [Colias croceus]CAG4941584.1 unnamed protein product [Colias eurytheme]